jgi:hypothetical protein
MARKRISKDFTVIIITVFSSLVGPNAYMAGKELSSYGTIQAKRQ